MNILFIEDERELQASGVMQLERKGQQVYPTSDLAESIKVLSDDSIKVDLVISDHRLPDGAGIQFLIELRQQFPEIKCVIVSGCLTAKDIETLEAHKIRYYQKPLLYARVLDDMRKKPSPPAAPVYTPPELVPEVEGEPASEFAGKKKKRFRFWPFG